MKSKRNLKKGAGIEIAILAMVVVFALSALLVSITLISKTNVNHALDDLTSDTVKQKVSKGLYINNITKITVNNNGKTTEYDFNS